MAETTRKSVAGIVREKTRKIVKQTGIAIKGLVTHGGYLDAGGRVQKKRLDAIAGIKPKAKK